MTRFLSAAIASLALAGTAHAAPITLDFNSLSAGDLAGTQFSGVTISGARNGAPAMSPNAAMIFDTNNFTGSDSDLQGPFDNPTTAPVEALLPGNVLIVSEDDDASDPDDAARGGVLTFVFDQLVTILSINAFDINSNESITFDFYDVNDMLITSISNGMTTTDDNEFLTFDFGITGVRRFVASLSGSGAIDDLMFEVEEVPVPSALPLLLSGLAGLGFASRPRKTKTA
jgi:hypothetical protein